MAQSLSQEFFSTKQPLFVLSSARARKEFYLHFMQNPQILTYTQEIEIMQEIEVMQSYNAKHYFHIFNFTGSKNHEAKEIILPSVLTISELFDKIAYSDSIMIPKHFRSFFILQALQNIKAQKKIKSNLHFLSFESSFTTFLEHSSMLLNFYDELRQHKIPITKSSLNKFSQSDTYEEYSDQLELLQEIYEEYHNLLALNNFTDSLFSNEIAKNYNIFTEYIAYFSSIHIELEGFISPLQYEILQQASLITPIFLHFKVDDYNINNFKILNQKLTKQKKYIYGIHNNTLFSQKDTFLSIDNIRLYKTKKSFNQANLAIFLAHQWQKEILKGNAGENDFAIILPNESFCNHLMTLDSTNLFNFAMGYAICNLVEYNLLHKIYNEYLQTKSLNLTIIFSFLEQHAESLHNHDFITKYKDITYRDNPILEDIEAILHVLFFEYELLLQRGIEILAELKFVMQKNLFNIQQIQFEHCFSLFMHDFSSLHIDDVGGGKIRVMGALEARNLIFKEVLILDFTDDYVPNVTHEDIFLNSKIRNDYAMPTRKDKENLYKRHYYNILKNAQISHIAYVCNKEKLPSNMLLELECNLENAKDIDEMLSYYDVSHGLESKFYEDKYPTFADTTLKLSATSMNMYKDCVRKFYFYYIEKLRLQTHSTALSMGQILHQWLYQSYQNYKGKILASEDIENIQSLFNKEYEKFRNDFFTNQENTKDVALLLEIDKMNLAMQKFFVYEKQRVQRDKIQILDLESEFSICYKNHNLMGYIDRIELINDTQIYIIDYKTGKKSNTKDLQMPFYLFCAEQLEILKNIHYTSIDCVIYRLQNFLEKEKIEALEYQTQDQYVKEIAYIKEILETFGTNNEMTSNRNICSMCDYTSLCNR